MIIEKDFEKLILEKDKLIFMDMIKKHFNDNTILLIISSIVPVKKYTIIYLIEGQGVRQFDLRQSIQIL